MVSEFLPMSLRQRMETWWCGDGAARFIIVFRPNSTNNSMRRPLSDVTFTNQGPCNVLQGSLLWNKLTEHVSSTLVAFPVPL